MALATTPGLPTGAGPRIALGLVAQAGVKGLGQVIADSLHRGLLGSSRVLKATADREARGSGTHLEIRPMGV